jgi:hypothetical protein
VGLAVLVVAVTVGLLWRPWSHPSQVNDKTPRGGPAVVSDSLHIEPLELRHFAVDGKEMEARGLLGEKSFATRFGDQLQLAVVLSEPAYFYVIAFVANGEEKLLWPADEDNVPQPARGPPKLARLRFPGGDDRLTLDDSPKGGLEVYAVAASRQPLPAYAQWRRERSVTWRPQPAGKVVWQADPEGTYMALAGLKGDRASVKEAVGVPPLSRLSRSLLGGGVETVEVIAFPVLPEEKRR